MSSLNRPKPVSYSHKVDTLLDTWFTHGYIWTDILDVMTSSKSNIFDIRTSFYQTLKSCYVSDPRLCTYRVIPAWKRSKSLWLCPYLESFVVKSISINMLKYSDITWLNATPQKRKKRENLKFEIVNSLNALDVQNDSNILSNFVSLFG